MSTLCALLLAGCASETVDTLPTPTTSPSATPTPEPDPEFLSGGTAAQNRRYFDFVNADFFAANGKSDGRSIIDNLVAAGFDKLAMEVTPDKTSIGLDADSIVFSVLIMDTCLVGQFTNAEYQSELAAVLGTERCLIGRTRPIDW